MNPARLIATGAATTLLLLPTPSCTTDHPAHPDPTPKTTKPSATPTDPQSRAEALVHRYFDILDKAIHSEDTSELQSVSLPSCVVCKQEIDFIDNTKSAQETIETKAVGIELVQLEENQPDTVGALVTTNIPAYQIKDQAGHVTSAEPAYRVQFDMVFKVSGDQMSIFRMDTLMRSAA